MPTLQKLEQITIEALTNAYRNHRELRRDALTELPKNQFGETVLKGDWEAEERVIETFRKHSIPITIISEEHGKVTFGKEFLGILDGLDGTNRFRAFMSGETNWRYGTMFGIFQGDDPTYGDYLVSGIMMHPTDELYIASRSKGAYATNLKTNERTRLHVSNTRKFDKNIRILSDYWVPGRGYSESSFQVVAKAYLDKLPGFNFKTLSASCAHYVDLARGQTDLVLEATRKGNLEISISYGMIKESGGIMLTADMRDIGGEKYFEFGQGKNEYVPVISAANIELVREFVNSTK